MLAPLANTKLSAPVPPWTSIVLVVLKLKTSLPDPEVTNSISDSVNETESAIEVIEAALDKFAVTMIVRVERSSESLPEKSLTVSRPNVMLNW